MEYKSIYKLIKEGGIIKKILNKPILIIALILIWQISSNYLTPLFLPKPIQVLKSLGMLIENGMLLKAIMKSFNRITIAMMFSIFISLPLALSIVRYKWLNNILTPITNILRYLPITAFYPLLILWLGINEKMKITFLCLATLFYLLPSMLLVIKEVDKTLIEEARVSGITEWQVIIFIVLPVSLPSICQTLLMMYGIGWNYITIAETVNANSGLGFLINTSSSRGRTDLVFVSIMIIALISWVFDNLGTKLIHNTFKWKYN